MDATIITFTIDDILFYDLDGGVIRFVGEDERLFELNFVVFGEETHTIAVHELDGEGDIRIFTSLYPPNMCHEVLKSCLSRPEIRLKNLLEYHIKPAECNYFDQFSGLAKERWD
jgi:hypothetical protein